MAEGIFLVTRTDEPGDYFINGIRAVIINADDGQTDAQTIAEAVARVNAQYPSDSGQTLPAGYFDTVLDLDNVAAGPLADDTDCYIVHGTLVKVESTV